MDRITCTVTNLDGQLNVPHSHLSTRVLRLIAKFPECQPRFTDYYVGGVRKTHYIRTFHSDIDLPLQWYDIIPGLVSYTVTGFACGLYTILKKIAWE